MLLKFAALVVVPGTVVGRWTSACIYGPTVRSTGTVSVRQRSEKEETTTCTVEQQDNNHRSKRGELHSL